MLKNIDPLLTPELLYVLAAMGHGDELAVIDANFPADSVARRTCHGRVVSLAGASMPEAVSAILSVLPLTSSWTRPFARWPATSLPAGFPRCSKRFTKSSTRPPDGIGQCGQFPTRCSVGSAVVPVDNDSVDVPQVLPGLIRLPQEDMTFDQAVATVDPRDGRHFVRGQRVAHDVLQV